MNKQCDEYDTDEILEYISINKQYYEHFCSLESGKKKFNWCSAIWEWWWLPFHFMFLEAGIFLLIELVVEVGLNVLRAWNAANQSICRLIDVVNLLYFVFLFFFWGFWGNSLLIWSIKRKIAFQRKLNGRADWIKKIYVYEKVMVLRVTSVFVIYVLALLIMWEVPRRIFSAIVY